MYLIRKPESWEIRPGYLVPETFQIKGMNKNVNKKSEAELREPTACWSRILRGKKKKQTTTSKIYVAKSRITLRSAPNIKVRFTDWKNFVERISLLSLFAFVMFTLQTIQELDLALSRGWTIWEIGFHLPNMSSFKY